jgi:tripartite-type tricarboxylate transporter receptor subunit TctC
MRGLWWFSAICAALLMTVGFATAEETYPSRPVHIMVPYPAGGGVDIVARALGDELSKHWGQPVIIDNRPGAGGVIASQAVATSPKDGYMLIVVASGHATNAFIYGNLPYDTFKDFTPISLLSSSPNILLVRADSPFKTLADILAEAKKKPGSLSYGHSGNGSSTHLAGELFKSLAKVDITGIPYKGGAPIITDLLGGHLPMSFNNAPESLGQISAGTLRALAVTTATRAPFLPNVPTMAEAGVPGYDTAVWWGLLGPSNMPTDVTAKIANDTAEAMQSQSIKDRLAKLGATSIGSSPQDFAKLIKSDYDKWGPIIKAAGIKAE